MDYEIYLNDTETTGFDLINCDIIELSLLRFKNDEQKTWYLKPLNFDAIEEGALRINGHKLEDITWKTAAGRAKYREPSEVIVEIENWIMEDNCPTENRVFTAFNVPFDLPRLQRLWQKCNSSDSFIFGRRSVDVMSLEFFMDLCKEDMAEGYALKNLVKKYGLKNEKAHDAAADTKVTSEIFKEQIKYFKSTFAGGDKDLISENKKMKLFIDNVGKQVEMLNSQEQVDDGPALNILELYNEYIK